MDIEESRKKWRIEGERRKAQEQIRKYHSISDKQSFTISLVLFFIIVFLAYYFNVKSTIAICAIIALIILLFKKGINIICNILLFIRISNHKSKNKENISYIEAIEWVENGNLYSDVSYD